MSVYYWHCLTICSTPIVSYSLIGSWGPALFPLPWMAFKEWWAWRSQLSRERNVFEPLTESLAVNHWYRDNRDIWTPWIIRSVGL